MDTRARALERAEQADQAVTSVLATVTQLARAGKSYAEIVEGHPLRVTALGIGYQNKTSDAVVIVVDKQIDHWIELAIQQLNAVREALRARNNHQVSRLFEKESDLERLTRLNAQLGRYTKAETCAAQIHPKRANMARMYLAGEAARNNEFSRANEYALHFTNTTRYKANLNLELARCAAFYDKMDLVETYASNSGSKYKSKAHKYISQGLAQRRLYDEAIYYVNTSSSRPDKYAFGELAVIAEQNKDCAQTDRLLALAKSWPYQNRIATAAAKTRNYPRAEQFAEDKHYRLGQIAAENGDYDLATTYLETDSRLANDPSRVELNAILARAAAGRGDTRQFNHYFNQYRPKGDTRDYDLDWLLGHLKNGNAAETESTLKRFSERIPESYISEYDLFRRCIELIQLAGGHGIDEQH